MEPDNEFHFSNLRDFLRSLELTKPRQLGRVYGPIKQLVKLPAIDDLVSLDKQIGTLLPNVGRVALAQALITEVGSFMVVVYPDLKNGDFIATLYLLCLNLIHEKSLKLHFSKARKTKDDVKSVELFANQVDPIAELGKINQQLEAFMNHPVINHPSCEFLKAQLSEAKAKIEFTGIGLLNLKAELTELIQHAKERLPIYYEQFGKDDKHGVVIRRILDNLKLDLEANGIKINEPAYESLTKAVSRGGSPKVIE